MVTVANAIQNDLVLQALGINNGWKSILGNYKNWMFYFICLLKYERQMTGNKYVLTCSTTQFYDLDTELDLHRIMSGFNGTFSTGVACQQGTLTLPDTWFRPPFWDLLVLQLLQQLFSNLPCLYSTFHFEYPSVLSRLCSFRRDLVGHNCIEPPEFGFKSSQLWYLG